MPSMGATPPPGDDTTAVCGGRTRGRAGLYISRLPVEEESDCVEYLARETPFALGCGRGGEGETGRLLQWLVEAPELTARLRAATPVPQHLMRQNPSDPQSFTSYRQHFTRIKSN